MEIAIFSDPHLHNYKQFAHVAPGGFNSRLLDGRRVLDAIASHVQKNSIPVTLCGGDLFHTFSHVENDVMNVMAEALASWPGKFVYIYGNHDLKVKESCNKDFAGTAVLSRMGSDTNLVLLDEGLYKYSDPATGLTKLTVFGVGWRKPEDFLAIAAANKADILLGHQLVANKWIPGGLEIPAAVAKNYKMMVIGDLHRPLWQGNLLVPGAPMQHNFGDEGQERGFWTVDTETWKPVFHPLAVSPVFVTVGSLKEVKKDSNFYRVNGSTVKASQVLPDNVAARRDIKQEFRESALSADMADLALCTEYVKLSAAELLASMPITEKDLVEAGRAILEKCESRSLAPGAWRIANVKVTNFMSIRGTLTFSFKEGLWLVSGENGVGKTTIFEAVHWCLNGTTTKGVAADEVVNDDEGQGCAVQVYFQGPEGYLAVNRERDAFQFHLEHGLEEPVIVKRESKEETRKELQRVLGVDDSFFKNICYFSQEDFEFFSTMSDADQKALCKNIRKIDRFETAEANAKLLSSDATKAAAGWKSEFDRLDAGLIERRAAEAQLEEMSVRWENGRAETLDRLLADSKAAAARVSDAEKKLAVIDDELADLQNQRSSVKHEAVNPSFEKAVDTAQVKLDAAEQVRLEKLSALSESRNVAERDHKQALRDAPALDGQLGALSWELKSAQQSLASLQAGLCPSLGGACPRMVPDKAVLAQAREAIAAIEEKISNTNKRKAILAELITRLSVEEDAAKKAWIAKDSELEGWRAEHRQTWQFAVEARNKEQARVEEAYRKATAAIDEELLSMRSNRAGCDARLKSDRRQIEEIQADIRRIEETKNDANEKLLALRKTLAALAYTHNTAKEEFQRAQAFVQVADFWARGFSNQGIVSYLLDGFAKEFTEAANDALLELSGGRFSVALNTQKKIKSGEWREKFELAVFVDGKKRPYKALSGGQKARVNLAAAVALTAIVEKQFGLQFHPLGILIHDELITELDSEGAEAAYDVLSRLAKKGCAVYAISHNDGFKALFDNVISVRFDKEKRTTIID